MSYVFCSSVALNFYSISTQSHRRQGHIALYDEHSYHDRFFKRHVDIHGAVVKKGRDN